MINSCVATRCGLLNLDSKQVEGYTQIAALTHVTALMASYSDFDDLGDIAAMSQLRELHLGRTQVRDFSGLSQLQELALGGNAVGNLQVVRGHPRLEVLDLTSADLPADLSALITIPNLREISVTEWNLSDDQKAVVEQLRARGVDVQYEVAVIVC